MTVYAIIVDLCGVPIFESLGAQVPRRTFTHAFEACPTKISMKIRIPSPNNIYNYRILAAPDFPKLMSGKNFTERLCYMSIAFDCNERMRVLGSLWIFAEIEGISNRLPPLSILVKE